MMCLRLDQTRDEVESGSRVCVCVYVHVASCLYNLSFTRTVWAGLACPSIWGSGTTAHDSDSSGKLGSVTTISHLALSAVPSGVHREVFSHESMVKEDMPAPQEDAADTYVPLRARGRGCVSGLNQEMSISLTWLQI